MTHDHRPVDREPAEFALLEGGKAHTLREACQPGPFGAHSESGNTYPSEMARAFATTVLILYPVVATVVLVLVSLFLTGASHSA